MNPIHQCPANVPPATPRPSHSKGRSPSGKQRWQCPSCGRAWTEGGGAKGRPLKGDSAMSSTDRSRELRGSAARRVTYALFLDRRAIEFDTGLIRDRGLVDVVVACSRGQAIKGRFGVVAIPLGELYAREKRWVQEFLKSREETQQEETP